MKFEKGKEVKRKEKIEKCEKICGDEERKIKKETKKKSKLTK